MVFECTGVTLIILTYLINWLSARKLRKLMLFIFSKLVASKKIEETYVCLSL